MGVQIGGWLPWVYFMTNEKIYIASHNWLCQNGLWPMFLEYSPGVELTARLMGYFSCDRFRITPGSVQVVAPPVVQGGEVLVRVSFRVPFRNEADEQGELLRVLPKRAAIMVARGDWDSPQYYTLGTTQNMLTRRVALINRGGGQNYVGYEVTYEGLDTLSFRLGLPDWLRGEFKNKMHNANL